VIKSSSAHIPSLLPVVEVPHAPPLIVLRGKIP
jgi:hypothetical protein